MINRVKKKTNANLYLTLRFTEDCDCTRSHSVRWQDTEFASYSRNPQECETRFPAISRLTAAFFLMRRYNNYTISQNNVFFVGDKFCAFAIFMYIIVRMGGVNFTLVNTTL